ncbi:Uncharacterised protein [Shigella sonnei]|nr:Uncharacterised protein [Shigella sonnei]CSS16654.1 Uncharacterised protein [Shigella sonnei]
MQFRFVNKPSRRINMPGSTNGNENISHRQRHINFIHAEWHFAKPNDVRAQGCRELATMAFIFWRNVSGPVENLTTLRTTNFQQFPMHMNDIGITCAFMQVVYILRYQQKAIAEGVLQFSQRKMRGVRLNFWLLQLSTTGVIKRLHQFRIAIETFRRCHIFNPMFFPQAICGAKGTNT